MDRKNIYIVILMMTTIIAACLAIYFGINFKTNTNNNDIKNEDGIIGDSAGNLNVNESSNIVNDNKVNSSSIKDNVNTTKEENTLPLRVTINTNKCLNPKENYEYNVYRSKSDSNIGINCIIKDNLAQIYFSNFDKLKSNYSLDTIPININEYEYITIDNFSNRKVVDVYLMGMGNAVGNEIIYFLMEDGTVEYMPIRKALLNNDIKSYGKIEELTNIVEIVSGSANAINGPGYTTPFAITKDGSFYELSTLVEKLLY